jgi:hypothetical protein
VNNALKTVVASIVALVGIIDTVVSNGGVMTSLDWRNIVDLVVVPVLVYFVPNIPKLNLHITPAAPTVPTSGITEQPIQPPVTTDVALPIDQA